MANEILNYESNAWMAVVNGGVKLIELTDEDVFNLDDVLPKMLLKFGVQTY